MTTRMGEVVRHIRRTALQQERAGLTDRELLGCFLAHRDEAAVATLVRRHGPMVWGVCRRILDNHHDAEDAFQATFLVLVRRAKSIRPRGMVGNWLYGVARQTALKARALRARRRARERQVTDMPGPPAAPHPSANDLLPVLDQELSLLPDKYRVAIVLCDLEGQTRKEAARQLGLPEGTVAGRLTRGRALLARRLTRNGAVFSAGALAAALSESAAPASVLSSAIKAATAVAAGQVAGAISARVAAVTEGVLQAMFVNKLKTVVGTCLVAGFLLMGSVFGYRTLAADKAPAAPPKDRLEDTLVLLDKQLWEATSNYDVDTVGKILADDWVGYSANGPLTWDKAKSLANYRNVKYVEVKLLTERRVFRVDEHTALMSYTARWRAEDRQHQPQGQATTRHIHCWVQRDGGWFIRHTECVNLPEPPPAVVPVPTSQNPLIGPFRGHPQPLTPQPPPTQPKSEPVWKRGVRASGTWQNEIPENAFDGKRDTDWNAGDYAPSWIERDLGASLPLSSITLFPCQDIPGVTVHEVWVSNEPIGNDRTKAKLIHAFEEHTTNMQALKFDFPKGLSARYIEVRTTKSPTWIAWWEIEIRVRDEKVVPLGPQEKAAPTAPPRADQAALQGTWRVVSIEMNGKEEKEPWADRHRKEEWVVKDRFITVDTTDPNQRGLGHSSLFVVRPDKSPMEIDLNSHWVGLSHFETDLTKGIYTFDGDVWKVCLPYSRRVPPPKEVYERPKEMKTKEGGSTVLITLKRVKQG
jgi:RNA polymerase sigma factor (sigma-70 family)